mgnify:CR=1 FL=1
MFIATELLGIFYIFTSFSSSPSSSVCFFLLLASSNLFLLLNFALLLKGTTNALIEAVAAKRTMYGKLTASLDQAEQAQKAVNANVSDMAMLFAQCGGFFSSELS